MSVFTEVYKPWNDKLVDEIGVDWFEFTRDFGPGLYPDTALLLVELCKHELVGSVLELGSGASTLYFEAICRKLRKHFHTVEEEAGYLDGTKELLSKHGLTELSASLKDQTDWSSLPAPDLIFLDSQKSSRPTYLDLIENPNWSPRDTKFIVVDDTQSPYYLRPFMEWCGRVGRHNTYQFNLIGRQDRFQSVNCLDPNFSAPDWFWQFRPDQKYW